MVINKHGSFYLRSGWGTKIINAVNEDDLIFSPSNEQIAIDNIGLGRIMIKALRYWADVVGLTTEVKSQDGIKKVPTELFKLIEKKDPYFQRLGTLLLLHRNMALNIDDATAWYWLFNEWNGISISKEEFADGLHSYLAVNGMKIKKDAVDKEFNCVKNTYIGEKTFDIKTIMDEDTYPFLAPLRVLTVDETKRIVKTHMTSREIPIELLIYSIAKDNETDSASGKQVSIDYLMEEKKQIGKYYNIRYSDLIDMLLEAENKGYIGLNNNFGNRYLEFNGCNYNALLKKYFKG
ncbi:MAG: DUF4007 family protein [Lachnospiraceae bacterium]|nr:DUF4007 family protein [Lachnospiraceae bacterium]